LLRPPGKNRGLFFLSLILLGAGLFFQMPAPADAASKEETLKKYEQVIARSNELTMYGYDVKRIGFKLKRMTDFLLTNDFNSANQLLDEISSDMAEVESKGPESLRKERQLAWFEILGDFIQQLALFLVLAFLMLRFTMLRRLLDQKQMSWAKTYRLAILFAVAAIGAGILSFIRYSGSSWAFMDLQVVFVTVAGMLGGFWPGILSGIAAVVFRMLLVPGFDQNHFCPLVVGLLGWMIYRVSSQRPYRIPVALAGGWAAGLCHALILYLPISRFLSFPSLLFAVFFLSAAEGVVFFFFFLLLKLIYNDDKNKETERELFRTQLQFLRAQINPHFLFNAFNTVAAICGEEGAVRARGLIVQISSLFRMMAKSEGDYVTLQEELDYIDTYLKIEKVRFGDRLQIEKDIQLNEIGLRTAIPVLVLQPIVENAVKHGLSKKEEGGRLIIRAVEQDERIMIEIRDTGVGMDSETAAHLFTDEGLDARPQDREHAGIGLRNIQRRLSKLFGERFGLKVESRKEEGTLIRISLPKEAS
jgi:LytS/YehU family sensor histidine kinase